MADTRPRPAWNAPAVDLLRAVAIALIINSHLDSLYPVPALATGGAIGNALFFALSGFGLAASARGKHLGLPAWYRLRICRIYPALVPAVLLFIALPGRAWSVWDLRDWTKQLIWPTAYWFVGALMLYYALLFPLLRIARPKVYLGVIAALFVPYLVWYFTALDLSRYMIEGEGHFKWIHYFQVMVFGAYLAEQRDRIADGAGWRDGALLAVVLVAYYGLILLVAGGRAGAWQGATHLFIYPILVLAMRFACSPPVAERFLGHGGVRAATAFVAGITLELYLVQGTVRSLAWVQAASFPLNALMCWVLTLAAAYLLHLSARAVARVVRCSP